MPATIAQPHPVVLLNGDYRPARAEKNLSALSWLNAGYYDSVAATRAIPLLLPPVGGEGELDRALDLADAVVLTGCPFDLDPVRLGFEPHPATRSMPIRREDFDRRLCEKAVERRIPVLAIGSGMQLLNIVCGGTIHQHVGEDVPGALHHRDAVENDLRHLLEVVPGTRLDAIYGPGEIRVNSHHHMAVDQVAPDFRPAAAAPDGVVEAIESADESWFAVGVQWHPENASSSALDQQLFEQLADAARGVVREVVPPKRRRRGKAAAAAA